VQNDLESNIARVSSTVEIDELPTDTSAVLVARFDDAKADALHRLNALRILYQDGSSAITDSGLASLVSIPALERLDLEWSMHITDVGLKELRLLRALRWLDLTGCSQLTREAVDELRAALPKCEVLW
jgi:hypothetical protein